MCNINIIYNKNKKPSLNLSNVMNTLSYNSFLSNRDSEGYLSIEGKTLKYGRSLNKIKYSKPYSFLATHQRLATSGELDLSNVHPHISENFLLMHNGVFYGLSDKQNSDTAVYLKLIQENYTKTADIVKSINETHKNVDGSHSILLVNKHTNELFYYKNNQTSMFYAEDKNYLIMSTEKENVVYAVWFLGIKNKIKEVKSHKLFKITQKGLIKVSNLNNKSYYSNIATTDYEKYKEYEQQVLGGCFNGGYDDGFNRDYGGRDDKLYKKQPRRERKALNGLFSYDNLNDTIRDVCDNPLDYTEAEREAILRQAENIN